MSNMQPSDSQPIDDPTTVDAANGRGRMLVIGLVALIAVVAATFFALSSFGGASAEVTLRSLGSAGDDPFTSAVAPVPSANLSDFANKRVPDDPALTADPTPTLAQYRTVSAAVPGVFGGSLNELTCDKDQLVAFLTSESEKAQAWASVLAMDVDNIGTYVDNLTGVNLGADTRVLDHGFSSGKLITREAVLQRGTAVLVDARGVPRVDCYSGNPLRQPTIDADETFVGTPWPTFNQPEVVVIADAPGDITEFELVNIVDGTSFVRPAGTTGANDLAPTAQVDEAEVAPTAVPTTPTPVAVTRELTMAGAIELNSPVTGEVGSTQDELIYTFDAPAGARLELQVTNDRASVGGVSVDLRSDGDRLEFFRVQPGGSETFLLTLSNEDAGQYEVVIGEGPGAFDFVVQAAPQDDAGQGRDAGAEFESALEISGGQAVTGHLGGLDRGDVYVLDLTDAPTLIFTATTQRGSQQAAAFDLQILGDRLDFFRVKAAAEDTIEVRFGPDDETLEIYVTEGPAEYGFTAELIPQQDGGQRGDAPSELGDARVLTSAESFTGQVGDRDVSDYYLFEAPADQFTVSVDVSAQSVRAIGVDVVRPDGVRIDFVRVQPGATGSIDVEGVEGEMFRLVITEGRGDYEVAIS